ncbi:MAG: tetratricopeptide repeat protein [Bacteroidia bacterium]
MSFKTQVALLLGAACLFIVIVLSLNNLNKEGAMIDGPKTTPSELTLGWEKTLENELKLLSIPESILKIEKGNLLITHEDTSSLRKSVEFSIQNNYFSIAAYLQLQMAKKTDHINDWNLAGQYIYTYAVQMQDTSRRDFLMGEAMYCFDKILEKEPDNRQATLYKGLALADKRETMMLSIPLLLKVVREDSTNILAQYTLGMLAIESGQYDKALNRFEKLISLQPSNAEYHFQAARTHELMGNKEQALIYYTKSLELTQNPEIQEQLKEIINQLK